LNNSKLFWIGSKKISLLGATNQNVQNVVQRLTWRDMEMRPPILRIENGMHLESKVIDVQFIKSFKDFQDTTIQLNFFRLEQGDAESGQTLLQVFA
jgi:hypothetical protein